MWKLVAFFGDGTWINNTTDLSSNNTYGNVNTDTSQTGDVLIPGGTVTVTTTIPQLHVSSAGRIDGFGGNYTTSDDFEIKLSEDIATKTWVSNQNYAKKSDVNTVIRKLNALIESYNTHSHNYKSPKSDAVGNDNDVTKSFNANFSKLDELR